MGLNFSCLGFELSFHEEHLKEESEAVTGPMRLLESSFFIRVGYSPHLVSSSFLLTFIFRFDRLVFIAG